MSQQSNTRGVWPQFPMDMDIDEQFDPRNHGPPSERLRSSSGDSRLPRGTTIFFKTRICPKFRTGSFRNGENCNYAHGMQELRQPPPNWQEFVGALGGGGEDSRLAFGRNWDDDQRIIHKMRLCKKFCYGEECSSGDRCSYLHEDPSKFRVDVGKFRERFVISIGTNGHPNANSNAVETNRPMNSAGYDVFRANMRPVIRKTKSCVKWERTGQCPFGDSCRFAHGLADEPGNYASSVMPKPSLSANNRPQSMFSNVPSSIEERRSQKCYSKLKGLKKINGIYGDWLDGMPLLQHFTSQVYI